MFHRGGNYRTKKSREVDPALAMPSIAPGKPMGALYIVVGFVFVGIVIIFFLYYSKGMKMTSYTNCQVVSAEERVVRDANERREETHLLCKYSVRGEEYQIAHVVRGLNAKRYPPGSELTVWYNPNVPTMAKIKGG
jgi:hypothetical protein